MKITKEYLKRVILEETSKLLAEEKDIVNLAGKPIETAFEAEHLIPNPQGLGMFVAKMRDNNEPYLTDFSRHVGHVLMMANLFATNRAEGLPRKGDVEFENTVQKKINEVGFPNYYPANKQLQIQLYTDIYLGFIEIRRGGDKESLSDQTLGAARAAIYNKYESVLSQYKDGKTDPAEIINKAATELYRYNQLIASQLSELGEGLAEKFKTLLKEVDQKAIAQKNGQAPPFVSLSHEQEEAAAKAAAAKLDAEFASKYGTGERGKEKFASDQGNRDTGTASQMAQAAQTGSVKGIKGGPGGAIATEGKITKSLLKKLIREEIEKLA